ncbi:MAG: glycosyltransferase [Verrucomicrobiia bacterium]
MRILAFYPYVPYPLDRGAHYRGFYLLRSLATVYDVDLLALSQNGQGEAHRAVFDEFCSEVEFVPCRHPEWQRLFPKRLLNPLPATIAHWTLPQAATALARRLSRTRYDAVHVFDIILAQYFSPQHQHLPIVADRTRVDLQYQLMELRRMRPSVKGWLLAIENLSKLWAYERRVARQTRLQIVCGPDDQAFVRRFIRSSLDIAVIPNGVDTTCFHPEAAPGERRSEQPAILFCGAMDYQPNIDALRWYFAEMHGALTALLPNLQLWIVGRDPGPEVQAYSKNPNVLVTGAVDDVRPFYRRAWVQIVPLRIGGGTRLKIVECMAMGTPVVSTTIGAQGLSLQHGRDVLLADTPEAFVRQTANALQNPALRNRLESAGLHTVRSTLSWPMLGRQLVEAYAKRFPSQAAKASPMAAQQSVRRC